MNSPTNSSGHHGPGIAGRIAAAFINSRLTALLVIASVLLGIAAIILLPREEEPQIKVPMIDVLVSMPGFSAKEVEERATRPMEKLLWEIPGVEYIYSTSRPGESLAIVRFKVGEDVESSLVKLNQKLQSNFDRIPPGVSHPLIKPRSIDDVPILALTFHSATYDHFMLRRLAAQVDDSVKQVPQVAETLLIGGARRQVRVLLDPARLASRNLGVTTVVNTLQQANQQVIAGGVTTGNREVVLETGAFLATAQDVGTVVVGVFDGRPVYLRDVAEIVDGPEEPAQYVFFGQGSAFRQHRDQEQHTSPSPSPRPSPSGRGSIIAGTTPNPATFDPSQRGNENSLSPGVRAGVRAGVTPPQTSAPIFRDEPAVTLTVAKRPGANAISVADEVLRKLDTLKGTLIPRDVEITVTRHYGETAAEKSDELLFHMGIAVVGVSVLILLTLGWRESGIVLLAIPSTLSLTLLVFYLYGYTLNRITLFALIFSIGILVDDAIVVIENIVRHFRLPRNRNRTWSTIAVEAVGEVGNPTILATFAVIAAVLPMAFVGGLMGPYMRPIPIGASAAMFWSLLIAFIVTPWAAIRILKWGRKQEALAEPGSPQRGDAGRGGTGDPPVPLGDSPDGTGRSVAGAERSMSQTSVSPVPPGESPGGAGGSPAPPMSMEGQSGEGRGAMDENKRDTNHFHSGHEEDFLTRLYRRFMGPIIHHAGWRWIFLGTITFLLLAAMATVGLKWVKVKMLPFDNKSEFQIILNMPEGSSLERTAQAAREIAAAVRTEPEVTDYQIYVGTAAPFNFNGLVRHYFMRQGAHVADLQINLVNKHDRDAQSHDIAKRVRPRVAEIARRFNARVAVAEVPPGPPVLQTLVAEIYGPDEAARTALSEKVREIFLQTPGVVDVDWYMEADQPKTRFIIDKEKAALHGISAAAISQTLQLAVNGAPVDILHDLDEKEDVSILLQLPREKRTKPEDLLALRIQGTAGALVPLRELVRLEQTITDKSIYHKNLMPVTYVIGDVAGVVESPVYAILEMNKTLKKLNTSELVAPLASPAIVRDGRSPVSLSPQRGEGSGVRGEDGEGAATRIENPNSEDPSQSRLTPAATGVKIYNAVQPFTDQRPAIKWDGEWHITIEVFRDLGAAFAAVLMLIYVLMIGWFRSFMTPLIVMVAIPFSLVGILPAHGLLGAFFTATSMIGFMAGAGIVVRNSIILVDFIEQRLREGMPLAEAVIDAGAVRFRPMLLTALAVVVGASVILFDPIFQGLAIALMAGEIASLLISRMAVPVLYFVANK